MPAPRPALALSLLCVIAAALAACSGGEPFVPGPPLTVTPVAPAIAEDPAPARGISVPEGFLAYRYASGLDRPTSIAFDPTGLLFVAELNGGVKVVEDSDGDGRGERARTFWRDPDEVSFLGLAVAPDGSLYVSVKGKVIALRDNDGDGEADEEHVIITGLPHAVHQNNGLAFGPDGMLYVTNGSTCNLCREEDERSATILRAEPDGGEMEVYARGLRNPYDLDFDRDGGLWATTNEHDFFERADEGLTLVPDPPEELNFVVEGGHYGWPECVSADRDLTEGGCDGKLPPAAEMAPHSSADGLAYYDGDNFPAEYRDGFFIAQFGSDERSKIETGREVVRVRVTRDEGAAAPSGEVTTFATGFESPLDVTVDAAGTLYVADFASGRIYRIVWVGRQGAG